ncbi:MAG TPA: putative selenate reductase subunit YgfK [Tenuifilaceae bacterium]|nr:putative selenate reductase subunit YgfK [Tenuifilaceae bacterium]
MSDKFYPVSTEQLLSTILNEYNQRQSIFGIPSELFFNPKDNPDLSVTIFNKKIATPLGVAAGPQSQMAQNIIAAWLMGCRYIELKTIQTLDELEVSKPCIDMQDEGYNCEWSQELKVQQSFKEYLKAWIIIHILNHKLGLGNTTDTIFNMSVGYNLEGIKKPNVQWFLDKMGSCKTELSDEIEKIRYIYPDIQHIDIPFNISDNITLSTMHGCPANEIEDIARYLITERKLHTLVKLNPTLIGSKNLREILNIKLKFKTNVPDIAFEHDLKYSDAIRIIKALQVDAQKEGLTFGVKLTNTLESVNIKNVFGSKVDMMYMSGRALHPISINLANKLSSEFSGNLTMSFSAGLDAFNVSNTLKCGFKTVTVSSDLLKPGGYTRLKQYIENISNEINANTFGSLVNMVSSSNMLQSLKNYAEAVLNDDRYKRNHFREPSIKTNRDLDYFDCIAAPCRETCATNQDIPDYLYYASQKDYQKALEVILKTNPFPNTTGMICDHLCQNKCTRINYDTPLQIREVKRFIAENADVKLAPKKQNGKSIAIIGAGPSGLSCAFYMAIAGFKVDVFEAKSKSGGMVRYAIPGFRLTDEAINKDISRVEQLGVNIHYNQKVTREEFTSLKNSCDFVYISAGAQNAADMDIEGINNKGVLNSLEFLFGVKTNEIKNIGKNVLIIGGGNTAMDAARTAHRLVGKNGKVTIVYRRTIDAMPADEGEIKAVIDEGVEIFELAAPEKIIAENGNVKGLLCSKMKLDGYDSKGRPKPVKVDNSDFIINCDTIIPAIGQALDIDFVPNDLLKADTNTYRTIMGNVYIGGDSLRGASTAIKAIGDGRKAANQMINNAGVEVSEQSLHTKNHSKKELMLMRSKRMYGAQPVEPENIDNHSFSLVSQTMDEQTVIAESARCLHCDEICNICTTVCPNLANFSYTVKPVKYNLQKVIIGENGKVEFQPDKVFEVRQAYQILNIANYCNECGNCATFCPTGGAPYMDKPKFHLTIESFNASDEGYMLSRLKDRTLLIYKQKGGIKTLSERDDVYEYESDHVYARFSREDFKLLEAKALTPCVKQIQFQHAAEMSIILQGAKMLVP